MEAARMAGIIVRMGVVTLSHWPHAPTQVMSQTLEGHSCGAFFFRFARKFVTPHSGQSSQLCFKAHARGTQFLATLAGSGYLPFAPSRNPLARRRV